MNEIIMAVNDLTAHDKAVLALIFLSASGGAVLGSAISIVMFYARR